MNRRTRELREMCCDEIAARTCADPGIYAEALPFANKERLHAVTDCVGEALLKKTA
jgi:hypothetical protein